MSPPVPQFTERWDVPVVMRFLPYVFGLTVCLVLIAMGWASAVEQRRMVHRDIQSQLVSSAAGAASVVDRAAHARVSGDTALDDPDYMALEQRLRDFKASRKEFAFVYTMRLVDGVPVFVVDSAKAGDADGDGVEDKALPYEAYEGESAEMMQALTEGIPTVQETPTTDKWGTYISAYAPLVGVGGRVDGIVGVDLDYSVYEAKFGEIERNWWLWLGSSVVVGVFLWLLLGWFVRRLTHAFGILVEQQETLEKVNLMLYQQARSDALTGMGNRTALEQKLADLEESPLAMPTALLFVDLDNFKLVNDAYGHAMGDELLTRVARLIRESFDGGDWYRFGGDEFVVLMHGEELALRSQELGEDLLRRLSEPMELGEQTVYPSASIGAAIHWPGQSSVGDLVRRADTAMYAAKAGGKNLCALYSEAMDKSLRQRMELEKELRGALERRELWIAWQPIINLQRGVITGAEALMRWTKADGVPVSPADFIPLAEEIGMIEQLGDWVLRSACAQIQTWNRNPLMRDVRLTVNVSARQMKKRQFAQSVIQTVNEYGVLPGRLVLEITESVLVDDVEELTPQLHQLREAGIMVAIDDFGTGYSSLRMLASLPFDILKIDRSFVKAMDEDFRSYSLIRGLLGMAQGMRLQTVAEGIERPEQSAELARLGCDYAQGFLYAPGMRVDQLEACFRMQSERAA